MLEGAHIRTPRDTPKTPLGPFSVWITNPASKSVPNQRKRTKKAKSDFRGQDVGGPLSKPPLAPITPREPRAPDKCNVLWNGRPGFLQPRSTSPWGGGFVVHFWRRPKHDTRPDVGAIPVSMQKRDLRQKLALEKPSEGVPCYRTNLLVVCKEGWPFISLKRI